MTGCGNCPPCCLMLFFMFVLPFVSCYSVVNAKRGAREAPLPALLAMQAQELARRAATCSVSRRPQKRFAHKRTASASHAGFQQATQLAPQSFDIFPGQQLIVRNRPPNALRPTHAAPRQTRPAALGRPNAAGRQPRRRSRLRRPPPRRATPRSCRRRCSRPAAAP